MSFERQLIDLINQYNIDSEMNIADYIVAKHVIRFMEQLKEINVDINDIDPMSNYDESMDGDHASALASAGFGTDEDYGAFGGTD